MLDMSMSELVKQHGYKSVLAFSQTTKVSVQTLRNWRTHRPELFQILLQGRSAAKQSPAHCQCGMCE